jgi:hypothetical protein
VANVPPPAPPTNPTHGPDALVPAASWNNVPAASPPPPVKPIPTTCPWRFQIEVVSGRTQLTARTGDVVQLQVACDNLDMQAPRGAIQASGAIKLTSPGLEGTGERLTINLPEDKVILDGKAQLRARREAQELELQADRLSLRIIDGRLTSKTDDKPDKKTAAKAKK